MSLNQKTGQKSQMQQQQHPPRQQQFHKKKSKAISREIAKTVRWSNKKTWKSSNKAFGEDWRLRKIGNSFAFELSKIENDCDVWNLKNEDKVEIVYQPRRENIVKKAVVVEDTSSEWKWEKFAGGHKLGRNWNKLWILR